MLTVRVLLALIEIVVISELTPIFVLMLWQTGMSDICRCVMLFWKELILSIRRKLLSLLPFSARFSSVITLTLNTSPAFLSKKRPVVALLLLKNVYSWTVVNFNASFRWDNLLLQFELFICRVKDVVFVSSLILYKLAVCWLIWQFNCQQSQRYAIIFCV